MKSFSNYYYFGENCQFKLNRTQNNLLLLICSMVLFLPCSVPTMYRRFACVIRTHNWNKCPELRRPILLQMNNISTLIFFPTVTFHPQHAAIIHKNDSEMKYRRWKINSIFRIYNLTVKSNFPSFCCLAAIISIQSNSRYCIRNAIFFIFFYFMEWKCFRSIFIHRKLLKTDFWLFVQSKSQVFIQSMRLYKIVCWNSRILATHRFTIFFFIAPKTVNRAICSKQKKTFS